MLLHRTTLKKEIILVCFSEEKQKHMQLHEASNHSGGLVVEI